MLPQAVSEHYRAQQRLVVATLGLTRREWSRMGPDFDASWRTVGPRLVLLTGSAQLGAARSGARYVPDSLSQLKVRATPDGDVNPSAFAGIASDGRSLESLLYESVIQAKSQVGAGATPPDALSTAGRSLDMYVHTLIADAARGAAGVAITARPKIGWVRMVNPPCCKRCAILAGKWFRYNQGFQRHPRCDCTHIPSPENIVGTLGTDPDVLFASGRVKGLGSAEQKAIRDGADPAQVVNAARGSSGMTTTESTTKRGVAERGRLTPDGIYRTAATRERAVELLRQHGYLR